MKEEMDKIVKYFGSKVSAAQHLGVHPQTWWKWEKSGGPASVPTRMLLTLAAENPDILTFTPGRDVLIVSKDI